MEKFSLQVAWDDESERRVERPRAIQRLCDGWAKVVEEEFRRYLSGLGSELDGAQLLLTFVDFGMKNESMLGRKSCCRTLAVRVSGTIDGRPVDFMVDDFRNLDLRMFATNANMAAAFTKTGDPALEAEVKVIAKNPDSDREMTVEQIASEPFFANFNFKLFEALDKQLGRDQSPLATRWRLLQRCTQLLTLVCFIAGTCAFYWAESPAPGERWNKLFAGMLFGAICAGFGWLFGYTSSAALMPSDFYVSHAAGRRILKFSGSENPRTAHVLMILSPIAILGFVAFQLFLFKTTFNR